MRQETAVGSQESEARAEDWPTHAHLPVRERLRRQLGRSAFWIILVDIAAIGAFAAVNLAFVNRTNLTNLALDGTEVVLLAVGEALLLTAGEFDISLGANLIVSSVVGGLLVVNLSGSQSQVQANIYPSLGIGLAVGFIACLLTGAAMGAVNGFVVTKMRVNSLIATLGTFGIATGLADILTNGSDVPYVPSAVQTGFGISAIGGFLPLPAVVVILVVAAVWWVFGRTRFGLHTVALGSSRTACERAGLRVDRQIFWLFTITGAMAGLSGLIDLSRFATTNISGHQTDALAAIAGAVIGGTALYGGQGSVGGAVAGAMLAVILQSGLVIAGLSPFYQYIAIGSVLILAVFLDQRRKRTA